MNASIKGLHEELIRTHQALAERLGKVADQKDAEAVLTEMEEVNFRIMVAGRLLFKEISAAIETQIETVIDAAADVEKSIKQIAKLKDLLKAVARFLSIVDKVLDKVKLV